MVARIDLLRLAGVADVIRKNPDQRGHWETVLWDSDNVEAIMPLAEGPIDNLPTHPMVLVVAQRRRETDPPGFFSFRNDDAEVAARARDPKAAWSWRTRMAGKAHAERTPSEIIAEERGGFIPTYFVISGSAATVFGDLIASDGARAEGVQFSGFLWDDATLRTENGLDQEAPADVSREMAEQGVWSYLSAVIQNLVWCVTHPEQFPLAVEAASEKPQRKDHVRAARKAGVDLAAVRVVELRPRRVVATGERGTGGHREYRYSFPVRGHWRQRGEKQVWVAGYWKAVDKPRLAQTVVERF